MIRNVMVTTRVTRTHPPGVCTPTREDAAEPPRPDNASEQKQHFF